jgi:hypothetical protein
MPITDFFLNPELTLCQEYNSTSLSIYYSFFLKIISEKNTTSVSLDLLICLLGDQQCRMHNLCFYGYLCAIDLPGTCVFLTCSSKFSFA